MPLRSSAFERDTGQSLVRTDRGAVSIEWVGLLLVAAMVAGATIAAVASPQLAQTVSAAVCRIVTLGQGGCAVPSFAAEDRMPLEPCTVQSTGYSVDGRVDVVNLGAGGQRAVSMEELSSGQYRVVVAEGASLGGQVGAGWDAQVSVQGGAFGEFSGTTWGNSMGASAEVMSEGRQFETYLVGSQEEALKLYQDALYDATVVRAAEGAWPLGAALVPVAQWVGGGFGRDPLPQPTSTTYLGGMSAEASAWITPMMISNAEATVGGQGLLGVTQNPDGTVTVHGIATSTTAVGGNFVTLDGSWPPEAGARIDVTFDGTEIRALSVGTEVPNGADLTRTQQSWTLHVESAADRRVAGDVLASFFPSAPHPGLPPTSNPAQAWASYFEAVDGRGEATRITYDTAGTNSVELAAGGRLMSGAGIVVGGGTLGETVSEAQYFDGADWAPWDACHGG